MQQDPTRTPLSIARAISEARHTFSRLQSEAAQFAALQLNTSLAQIIEIQQYLSLRVEWTPEQMKRQQERVARHQARLRWQQAALAHLREERGHTSRGNEEQ